MAPAAKETGELRSAREAPPPRKPLANGAASGRLNPPAPSARGGRRGSAGSVFSESVYSGSEWSGRTGRTGVSGEAYTTYTAGDEAVDRAKAAEQDEGRKRRRRRRNADIVRFRSGLHRFMHFVAEHKSFESVVMCTILVNMISMAMETDKKFAESNQTFFITLDLVSLVVYTAEFVIKLYVWPKGYWSSGYNRFDLCILSLSYLDLIQFFLPGLFSSIGNVKFLRVLRGLPPPPPPPCPLLPPSSHGAPPPAGLRALRALRGISFVEPLQVFISAIVKTMQSAVHLLILLFLIMYVFAIMAFNFFGDQETKTSYWNSLPNALFSLFDWTTADNWGAFVEPMEEAGNYAARFFAIAYIAVGHFVFTNLFIGIVVENLDEAQSQEVDRLHAMRQRMVGRKKAVIAAKQAAERRRLLEGQMDFMRTLQQLDGAAGRVVAGLRHDELVPMRSLACNPLWMDAFARASAFQEASIARAQHAHFEIARTLAELVQRRLAAVPSRRLPSDVGPGSDLGSPSPPPDADVPPGARAAPPPPVFRRASLARALESAGVVVG
eukprot:tig00021680_g23025.t1